MNRNVFLALLGMMVLSASAGAADVDIARFDANDWAGWTAEGAAFGAGPVRDAATLRQLEIENVPKSGGVASSEREGDRPTGTLTSPAFTIERRFIKFTVAGGNYERHTCVDLEVDGKVVRSATGWRSDRLTLQAWDVGAWKGKSARIRLVDGASGDWGHINVGPIAQSNDAPAAWAAPAALYHESLRPQFHFTARQWMMNRANPREREEGWLNDLNGLIYYEGEYHLFAQRWNKCWIHAVSTDLVRWTEIEPAFWEDELDSAVQSGTCVIDYKNTAGLSPDKSKPAMVAFFSLNDNKTQCMAYSLDKGRTWTRYAKNPVLVAPERDPKVFWHEPTGRWVMMLYGDGKYHVYTSTNLTEWKETGQPVPKSFECPDLFEMPVEGTAEKKWVLIQGNGQYSVGRFDGTQYTEEVGRFPCDHGDFYATQSWHNTDTGDGRRVQAAWMRFSHFPDMPFSQQVTFPCELKLRQTPDGLRIFRRPVKEIETLQAEPQVWTDRTLAAGARLPLTPDGRQFRLVADVKVPPGAKLILDVRGRSLTLTSEQLAVEGRVAKLPKGASSLEVLIDTASIEAFANDGETAISRFTIFPGSGLTLRAEGGGVEIKSLKLFPLRSAWEGQPRRPD